MKRFGIIFGLLLLCGSAFGANIVTATVVVTNAAGTSNGMTITVNASVRTWTNNVQNSATQIQTNSTIGGAATNLFRHIASAPFSGLSLSQSGTNGINLGTAPAGALSVSLSAGWGTVTLTTNALTSGTVVRVPYTVEPTATQQTNIVSGVAAMVGSYSGTNVIPLDAPAMALFANRTNAPVSQNIIWTNGTLSGTNTWSSHLLGTSLGFYANNVFQLLFNTNGQVVGGFAGNGSGLTNLNPDFVTNLYFIRSTNGIGRTNVLHYPRTVGLTNTGALSSEGNITTYGDATVTSNLTVSGDAAVAGNLTVAGYITNATFYGMANFPAGSDLAFGRYDISSLANGENQDVPVGTNTYINLSGPTAAFSICGFASARNGKIIIVVNQTGFAMTLKNEAGCESTAGNRILTLTGTDVTLAGSRAVMLVYNSSSGRWVIVGSGPGASVAELSAGTVLSGGITNNADGFWGNGIGLTNIQWSNIIGAALSVSNFYNTNIFYASNVTVQEFHGKISIVSNLYSTNIFTTNLYVTASLNLSNVAANKILRTTSNQSVGAVTIGSGLSFDGTTLSTSGSGSQTPWVSDINGAGKQLTNVANIVATNQIEVQDAWTMSTTQLVGPSDDFGFTSGPSGQLYLGAGSWDGVYHFRSNESWDLPGVSLTNDLLTVSSDIQFGGDVIGPSDNFGFLNGNGTSTGDFYLGAGSWNNVYHLRANGKFDLTSVIKGGSTGLTNSQAMSVAGALIVSNVTASKILRTAADSTVAAVTVGSGLSFDGTTLTATGSGLDPAALTNSDTRALIFQDSIRLSNTIAAATATSTLKQTNGTPATVGNQAYSPFFEQEGNGWKTTATAASQPVAFHFGVVPIQLATSPGAYWLLEGSTNGSAFGKGFAFSWEGNQTNFGPYLAVGNVGAGQMVLTGPNGTADATLDAGTSHLALNGGTSVSVNIGGVVKYSLTSSEMQPASDNSIDIGDGTHRYRLAYLMNNLAVTADQASTSNAMSSTSISGTLVSGKRYEFTLTLFVSESVAADGVAIDFDGGSVTMTDFRAHATVYDTALVLSQQVSGIDTDIAAATITGDTLIVVRGYCLVNTGGTFIPRFSQASHSSGTLTLRKGSNLVTHNLP